MRLLRDNISMQRVGPVSLPKQQGMQSPLYVRCVARRVRLGGLFVTGLPQHPPGLPAS